MKGDEYHLAKRTVDLPLPVLGQLSFPVSSCSCLFASGSCSRIQTNFVCVCVRVCT